MQPGEFFGSIQQFLDACSIRSHMNIQSQLDATLDYCEYLIRGEYDSNEKVKYKSKKRKKELPEDLINALQACTREQKVLFFTRKVYRLKQLLDGNAVIPVFRSGQKGFMTTEAHCLSFNIKVWKKKRIMLDRERQLFYAEKDKKIKNYDLANYLIRESKNKDYCCFALEAINDIPHIKSRTVRIGFLNLEDYNRWLEQLRIGIEIREFMGLKKIIAEGKVTLTHQAMKREQANQSYMTYQPQANVTVKAFPPPSNIFLPMVNTSMYSSSLSIQANEKNKLYASTVSNTLLVPDVSHFEGKILSGNHPPQDQRAKEVLKSEQPPPKQNDVLLLNEIDGGYNTKDDAEQFLRQLENEELQIDRTIIQQLTDGDNMSMEEIEERIEKDNQIGIVNKMHMDIFKRIMPQYDLNTLFILSNFEVIHHANGSSIAKDLDAESPLRFQLTIKFGQEATREAVLAAISKPELFMAVNSEVQDVQVKMMISSENSALMYLKLKAFSRFYRARDYVFIRHSFRKGNTFYIADQSIENANYPPFMTIVRGRLSIVWAITQVDSEVHLRADVRFQHSGVLTPQQDKALTVKFLNAFSNFEPVFFQISKNVSAYSLFDSEWGLQDNIVQEKSTKSIKDNRSNGIKGKLMKVQLSPIKNVRTNNPPLIQKAQIRPNIVNLAYTNSPKRLPIQLKESQFAHIVNQIDENDGSVQINNNETVSSNKSILNSNSSPSTQPQIERIDTVTTKKVIRTFGPNGTTIMTGGFIRRKYVLSPFSVERCLLQSSAYHPIWKGEWVHDPVSGPIKFINQKKIQDQKGVLKFVLSKMGKNLLSGKSILNISLPVDIFGPESNLERLLFSLSYAPILLEGLQNANAIERLKKVVSFGLGCSILYLSMEKPFNPILGETFQCWIDGCPGYAEQISHHPPIGALLFIGRGYKISAHLESKVELHMNSGTGSNDGVFKVEFDDGMTIKFITPAGEVSGLTVGERKFNLVGKSYYWIEANRLLLELTFDATKKGFFSVGKQQKPVDFFQGVLYEVSKEAIEKIQLMSHPKQITDKSRFKQISTFEGIWSKNLKMDGSPQINFDLQFPARLQYQAEPLPSDANWREDIGFRRLNEVSRAQTFKEMLEVSQRKDRKLREPKDQKKH